MTPKGPPYLLLIFAAFLTSCELNYINYIDHIESPDGRFNFALYVDETGIGDPGFRVLKIEKNINPEDLIIPWTFKDGISREDDEWLLSREVLSNYEESSFYTSNPRIELIDNRFLVFYRGGYMFGLFDLKLKKDTFNNCCPWSHWASQNIWAEKGTDYSGTIEKNEKSDYGLWVEKNIHNPIKEYIEENK